MFKLRIYNELKQLNPQKKHRPNAEDVAVRSCFFANLGRFCLIFSLCFLLLGTENTRAQQQYFDNLNPDIQNTEAKVSEQNAPEPAGETVPPVDDPAPTSRWALPRPHLPNLPNMPSVHTFLPPRNTQPIAPTGSVDLPGFQGYIAAPGEPYAQKSQDSSITQASGHSSGTPIPLQAPVPFGPNGTKFGRKTTAVPKMPTFSPPIPDQEFNFDAMNTDNSGGFTLYYPRQNLDKPISITAKSGWSRQVDQTQIYFLDGFCTIQQGSDTIQGPQAVVWVDHSANPKTVYAYLESADLKQPLTIELSQGKADALIQDQKWYGSFATNTELSLNFERNAVPSEELPPIYARAEQMRFPGKAKYRPRQYTEPSQSESVTLPSGKKADFRSVQFDQRSTTPMEVSWENDPATGRGTALITNGFTIILKGITVDGVGKTLMTGDAVDISADRGVIWTENMSDLLSRSQRIQDKDLDLEIYLEGNIVFREGDRTIFAKKMYYDVKNNVGYILDAELLAPTSGYEGLVRMKTETLQQTGVNRFLARNAFVTTSRLGEPSYRIQSNQMTFEEINQPLYDSQSGAPLMDAATGQPQVNKRQLLVAENNVVCLGPVPVLYWPWMAADLNRKDPFMYIRSVNVGHSGMFGTEVRTTWNPYQIFNIKNQPEGTDWDISVDYLSKRGLGHGTNFTYSRNDFFWFPGASAGLVDFWGIYDSGIDNLSHDRRELIPESSYRYRALWKHRQELGNDWMLTAEVGKMSDRNFMQQYFEHEWDTLKNQSTDLELKKTTNNRSFSVFGAYRLDDFVTDTNQASLNHFWMGQSLLEDRLTWYEHTRVGFAQLEVASAPSNANGTQKHNENYFSYLPWELDPVTGQPLSVGREVISTKHELDLPFSLGPMRFVPYILGELAHWGEDAYGDSAQRFYYQAGLRANLPMWKLMPGFQSRTWYANGLAHKIDFDAEFSHAGSDVNWDRLAQYDALDDYSVQDSRRRFAMTTYGGAIPVQYDERYYAIRSGLAGNVSSPATALADDLTLLRFGMKNRWQTKRGPSGNRRIIDWITFDTHLNIYPENEQNFGETLGLIDYDFRWHVGDRFALLSSGIYDVFSGGQKITRIGCLSERPGRGSVFLGVDRLEGYFEATYLNLNIRYIMNEKYSLRYGMSYNLTDGEGCGNVMEITRTGESFALSLGTSFDPYRDNVGVNLSIQPVFLSNYSRRTR